jgi:hypothetical protein
MLFMSGSVQAGCQDQVDELRDKINDNKDDYTLAARREAKRHLAAAEVKRLSPLECREKLREARQALRQGREKD